MSVEIPVDMYESHHELVFVIPLGGVKKESVSLTIEDYKLVIRGERVKKQLRDDFVIIKEECFWGPIEQTINLPSQIVFDKIHSKLSKENILEIILPKYAVPERVEVEVE